MMLKEKIAQEFTEALKKRDERKLSALRLLRTEVKKREVAGEKKELSDAEVLECINTLAKQRRESIRLFREGHREDLVEKEEAELQILLSYLPQPFSPAELEALIDPVIGEIQAMGPKDQGKVMKAVMLQVAGRADGKAVSEIVKQKLSKLAS
ncbi:MAG: GatB/YqeY domain-containing protein [Deltaproteobacteria bacterium]|nr:GatB/YqeY domain-containing protein [Deltaproteobacteria bacterium]